jgi:hypothetical protein
VNIDMSKKSQKQRKARNRKQKRRRDMLLLKPRISLPHNLPAKSIPTEDYLSGCNLDEPWGLEEALDGLICDIERGYFLQWEAVVRNEKGLPLDDKQAAILEELIDFTDDASDDRILYIDDRCRPNEPWYEIIGKLAPRLLMAEFKTYEAQYAVFMDGWSKLVNCLDLHGCCLSLPEGVIFPLDVISIDLQHRLWLQSCCEMLMGIGQYEELSLEREDQYYRINNFIDCLKEHIDSVKYLDLTLEKLLTFVLLPSKEKALFIEIMLKTLGISSITDSIAEVL